MGRARLLGSLAVAGLLAAACGAGKGTLPAGGGGAGAGGRGGASGEPLTRCPPTIPELGAACQATGLCGYAADRCRCEGCTCGTIFACINGKFEGIEVVDNCPLDCKTGGAGGSGWDASGGGADGSAGAGGAAAGGASGSGGVSGSGGASGSGGTPLTSCPAQAPMRPPCAGSFSCDYSDCRCGGCCTYTYQCTNEKLEYVRHTSDCMRVCDAGVD